MKKVVKDPEHGTALDPAAVDGERRKFLTGALAAVPAVTLLAACGAAEDAELHGAAASFKGADERYFVGPATRKQRRQWVARHVAEENQHDIDGIMRTFARETEVVVNGAAVTEHEAIRAGHVGGGFSDVPGGLADVRVVPQHEYITDDEIVYEGLLMGTHVGNLNGFPPTLREVAINYVAFYRFDRKGKLVSERLTFNYGVLAPPPA